MQQTTDRRRLEIKRGLHRHQHQGGQRQRTQSAGGFLRHGLGLSHVPNRAVHHWINLVRFGKRPMCDVRGRLHVRGRRKNRLHQNDQHCMQNTVCCWLNMVNVGLHPVRTVRGRLHVHGGRRKNRLHQNDQHRMRSTVCCWFIMVHVGLHPVCVLHGGSYVHNWWCQDRLCRHGGHRLPCKITATSRVVTRCIVSVDQHGCPPMRACTIYLSSLVWTPCEHALFICLHSSGAIKVSACSMYYRV
jgi:hypothetical protein